MSSGLEEKKNEIEKKLPMEFLRLFFLQIFKRINRQRKEKKEKKLKTNLFCIQILKKFRY